MENSSHNIRLIGRYLIATAIVACLVAFPLLCASSLYKILGADGLKIATALMANNVMYTSRWWFKAVFIAYRTHTDVDA